MSAEESDFDDDIDKLLDEIDSVSTQKKTVAKSVFSAGPTVKPQEPASLEGNGVEKVSLKSDGNGVKVNFGGGGFKLSDLKQPGGAGDRKQLGDTGRAVHFPENPISGIATNTATAQPPNSFLSSLLGSDNKAQGGVSTDRESPTPGTAPKGGKSDWLGLTPSPSVDPLPSTPPMARRFQRQPTASGLGDESTVNFGDDDDDELLRAMGLDSGRKAKNPVVPEKKPNPAPSAAKPKSGFDLDDDFWPKPGSLKPPATQAPVPGRSETFDKPESTLRSSLLQRAAMTRDLGRPESPFETPAAKFQPTASSTPSQPVKSIVDVLPFLAKHKPVEEPESLEPMSIPERAPSTMRSFSPAAQDVPATGARTAPQKPTKGKKSQQQQMVQQPPPVQMFVDPNRNTLQLPSHLVDEDELKSMCSSLKTLYVNQLDMQEKSYQDQMACMVQSHIRKEELLREEIKVLHMEYDSRMARLKNELLDSETKLPQRLQAEFSTMANISQQLQTQQQLIARPPPPGELIESPRSVQPNPSSNTQVPPVDLTRILDDKFKSFMESVQTTLASSATTPKISKDVQDLSSKLDSIQKKFDAFAKYRMEEETKKNLQLYEAEKKFQEEMAKLIKQQKKIKEGVVKAAVMSITQTMEYHQEDSNNKKDKIAGQLKEFRKDVRRILFDLEAKNETVQKSHVNIESHQKEMLQAFRELQTLVKVNSVQAKFSSDFHSSNMPYPAVHSQQVQQAEMEIKLLREERNSLSDSIAQMNVERRKLNEEKLNIERDRMELEREKNRMRDLEMQLKIKTAEAEDMKKHAEDVRKTESSKALEMTMKTVEVEKERTLLKDQFHLSENRLRMREQKLIQEKTELMREKEFLEKLRDQLLCPGCMKSVHHISSRSDGDGLDVSYSMAGDISSKLQTLSAVLPPSDQSYLKKESLFLDDLYFKQFSPK